VPREITFETPTDPGQFGPEQMRPRVLVGLSMSVLTRWFAAYLVPYSRLLNDHLIGFVFTTVRLDADLPALRFADADWLLTTGRVTASDSAKYLRLDAEIRARLDTQAVSARRVAAFHADMRVVTVVEDLALTAEPGILPENLFTRFQADEIYQPDRAALAQAAVQPDGKEIFAGAVWEFPLCRSQCEVADQWAFTEIMELLTTARERLFLHDATPPPVARLALGSPVRSTGVIFQRALYVFDTCRITTRVLAGADHHDQVVFLHSIDDPAHAAACATAWEITEARAPRT
jgi:hypothetical protein